LFCRSSETEGSDESDGLGVTIRLSARICDEPVSLAGELGSLRLGDGVTGS
jgi:hypothetical protein